MERVLLMNENMHRGRHEEEKYMEGHESSDHTENSRRLNRFRQLVTIGLIIVCNGLLLTGLWVSGVNLETVLSKPELYDPENGHCVRVVWSQVAGVDGLIKVCTEWLDFSDISGKTHVLTAEKSLAMGADGNLYVSGQGAENYRLIGLMIFVIVVVGMGMWIKGFLITKYQSYLQRIDHSVT